jgi:hypothetical protein
MMDRHPYSQMIGLFRQLPDFDQTLPLRPNKNKTLQNEKNTVRADHWTYVHLST